MDCSFQYSDAVMNFAKLLKTLDINALITQRSLVQIQPPQRIESISYEALGTLSAGPIKVH